MAMNKEAAITIFVKKNFNFLTSNEYDRTLYKIRHREYFFDKHDRKFGMPSPKDICESLINYQRTRGVPLDSIIKQVEYLPIYVQLGDKVHHKIIATLNLDKKTFKSSIGEDDIERIKGADSYQAVLKHKKKEIEESFKDKEAELQQLIQQKKEEYESLESVLDQEEFEEPEFDPEYELEKPWWERLYLKSNPFPQKDGLSSVDQYLYEAVVVKTKPFARTLSNLDRDASYLFNTAFLLVGNFGYGKTTFMDYLSYYLVRKLILPIRIVCSRPFPDSGGFSNNFFLSLRKRLASEGLTIIKKEAYIESDVTDQVLMLIEELLKRHEGVVLFLDDYHKHESSYKEIFEFLGSLQILKDELTRKKLNVGFIVSGIQDWNKELLSNPQMSGFFDSGTIEMPEITVHNVCDVFNQRIKAFCYDQNPRSLRHDFVQSIFNKAKGAAGYRDYLTFIIKELENNNYAIVNTPIKLTDEELSQIKEEIETNQSLSAALDKLVFGSKFKKYTSEQVGKCLEIVVHISLQDGISEYDILFRENNHYFQRLKDLQFLQKRKTYERGFKWVIKTEFQQVFDLIKKNHNKSISDYLLKIYGGKTYHSAVKKQEGEKTGRLIDERRFFSSIQGKLEKTLWEKLLFSLRLFDAIENIDLIVMDIKKIDDKAINAIESISHVLFLSDHMHRYFKEANISTISMRWDLHWFENEDVREYLKRLKEYLSNPDRHNYERLMVSVNEVFPAILQCIKIILEDRCTPVQGGVEHMAKVVLHTSEERALFDEIKKNYYSTDRRCHFRYLEGITDYLERRFRLYLYSTISLLFGEQQCIECMPKQIKQYAMRSMNGRENYASFYNPFNGLTRPQFRQIFNDDKIKRFIVSNLNLTWMASDWDLFFNLFADINIATSHQQIDSISSTKRDDYMKYCKMAEQITSAINNHIATIPVRHSYVLHLDGDKAKIRSPEDILIKYSYKLNKDYKDKHQYNQRFHIVGTDIFYGHKDLFEHELSKDKYRKIHDNILGKLQKEGYYLEDMMEIDYITSTYDVSYPEFISTLSYASLVEQSLEIYPWYGSSILIKKS